MYKSNTKFNIKNGAAASKKCKALPRIALFLILCLCFTLSLNLSGIDHTPNAVTANATACYNFTKDPLMLYPGGMPFGVRFNTAGLIVVGISEVDTQEGNVSPAKSSGISIGDVITKVNSVTVNTPEELTHAINSANAFPVTLEISRGQKSRLIKVSPQKSLSDGLYHLGIFVRNQCAGIGTVSYIMADSLEFAGLGHGICDADTGNLIPFLHGEVTPVVISQVIKGRCGAPGELRGYLSGLSCGKLSGNLKTGVYGTFSKLPEGLYYSSPIPAANPSQVKPGDAEILCTTSSGKIGAYKIRIEKINMQDKDHKNFAIKVTDKRLIDITGGIVQGMSGSSIIQDGRLVGAVTHVLVDDPTSGYGIFIGNMLDAAG